MSSSPATTTRSEATAPEQRTRSRHRKVATRRLRRPFVLLCAVAFFFAPAAARVFGQHATQIENKKLAAFPSLSQGYGFFKAMNQWSIDHLPLRQYAIRGNDRLSESLFGQPPSYGQSGSGLPGGIGGPTSGSQQPSTPGCASCIKGTNYPTVIQGRNGWLYYGGDPENACVVSESVAADLAQVRRLADAITASGRRFIFVVPPNKTTIYPDQLPSDFQGKDCLAKRRSAFFAALAEHPPTGYLPLNAALLAQQKADGVPIYRKTDTHWNPRGATVFARQLAGALQPNLWTDTNVVPTGNVTTTGDLTVLQGTPGQETYPGWAVVRDGVTAPAVPTKVDPFGIAPRTFSATSTKAPLYEPRTLLLGDSFGAASIKQLVPLFGHLTIIHNTSGLVHPRTMAAQFVDNQTIVLEIVERTQEGGHTALFEPNNLGPLIAAVQAHPWR